MTRKTKRNQSSVARGFTLIELLLVLVILGVLAAIVVPKFTGRTEQTKKTAAQTEIANIGAALDTFEITMGRFPRSDEGLGALVSRPSDATEEWKQSFKSVPLDPWNNEYVYVYPGKDDPEGYDLYSKGPDGQDNTEDDVYAKQQ